MEESKDPGVRDLAVRDLDARELTGEEPTALGGGKTASIARLEQSECTA